MYRLTLTDFAGSYRATVAKGSRELVRREMAKLLLFERKNGYRPVLRWRGTYVLPYCMQYATMTGPA